MLFEPSTSIIWKAERMDSFECLIALKSLMTPIYYLFLVNAPPLLIFLINSLYVSFVLPSRSNSANNKLHYSGVILNPNAFNELSN